MRQYVTVTLNQVDDTGNTTTTIATINNPDQITALMRITQDTTSWTAPDQALPADQPTPAGTQAEVTIPVVIEPNVVTPQPPTVIDTPAIPNL